MKVKYRTNGNLCQNKVDYYVDMNLEGNHIENTISNTIVFCSFIAEYLCLKDTQFAKEMVEYFGDEFDCLIKRCDHETIQSR